MPLPRRTFKNRPGGPSPEARSVAGGDSWIVSPTLSGVIVNEDTVPTIGAYYAGVGVLCSDISSIPFQVMRREPDGSQVVDESHPVHELVYCEPDPGEPEMSAMAWVASSVWHLNTLGNAYSRIRRDGYLRPTGLVLLDPRKVTPKRSSYGKLYYDVDGEKVLPQDILHVAAVGYDGIVGKSPITQSRETLGVTMAVEKFGASYFGNGINPSGIVEIPEELDELQTRAFRAGINREHQGPYSSNKFMLLQGGAKFTPTSLTNEDAQFLATRKFQLEEICRILRLPPTKLQNFDKASFSNIEEVNQDYYTSSLKPWLKRFQVEFNRKLFARSERKRWRVDHDVTEILKGRMVDQANVDKIYSEIGALNRDEIRAQHGRGKIEGGSAYLVQLNQAPLDQVAKASLDQLKGVKPADDPKPEAQDPAIATDAEAPVAAPDDVQSAALNGAQIASMLEIVQQVATGALPVESAKALTSASFPTLTPGQVDGIFASLDGFEPTPAPAPAEPPAVDAEASARSAVLAAAGEIVADNARRVARREANAVRKVARRSEISGVIEGLDEFYAGEVAFLAEAYRPVLGLFAAIAPDADLDAEAFASDIVARSRSELLRAIEGDGTSRAIAGLADRWEAEKPAQVLELLNQRIKARA
jgi:HK97 family phage portal protein